MTAAANFRFTDKPTPAGQAVVAAYHKLKAGLPDGVEPSNYAIASEVGIDARAVLYHRRKLAACGYLPYRPDAVPHSPASQPAAPPQPAPRAVKLSALECQIVQSHPKLAATGPVWVSRMARYLGAHNQAVGLAWSRLLSWGLLPRWDEFPGHDFPGLPQDEARRPGAWRIDHAILERERARKIARGELSVSAHKSARRRASDPRPKWSPALSPKEACDVMRHEDRRTIRRRRKALARGGAA